MSGLHQLKSNKKNRRRVGRGNGSGHGTYSGRGSKGQKQRGSVPFLFEGGQLPLIKKLPHMRGLNNIWPKGVTNYKRLDLVELIDLLILDDAKNVPIIIDSEQNTISFPPINSSNLSAIDGFTLFLLERGETSIGYSITKVGWINFGCTVFSKI